MITGSGWCTFATRIPGPADKIYSEPNSGIGFACHSIVGSAEAALARFLSTDRLPNGMYTPAAAASCTFILKQNGELIQMYPITASTWTSGSRAANTQYIAMELEGGALPDYGEPMTGPQVASFVLLVRDLETKTGVRYVPNVNMLQHKQLVALYGGGATACASDRYDLGWAALQEDDMTPELLARLERVERLVAGYGVNTEAVLGPNGEVVKPSERLTGEAALTYADEKGLTALLGIQGQNAALTAHKAETHVGGYTEMDIERIAIDAVSDKLAMP